MERSAQTWQDEYRGREDVYRRLMEEALFTARSEIARAGIKTHSITGRVKTLESLEDKAQRKSYTSPLADTPDVVGVRIVVLFLSDLPKIAEIVRSVFEVVAWEDKIEGEGDSSTFGYMSQHFEVLVPSQHSGPRYDDLRGIRFEVQVRTLLMDAWANVSHYLAYKGEPSIPTELRKDFFALSGLFYVADKHFEIFFQQAAFSVNVFPIVTSRTGRSSPGSRTSCCSSISIRSSLSRRC